MVQYRSPCQEINDTNFWKLMRAGQNSGSLQPWFWPRSYRSAAMSHHPQKLPRIYEKLQRGLLNYDACSLAELVRFCEARGLDSTLSTHEKRKSRKLRKRLEQADEHMTFDKFLELPPEIRLYVYEWHQAWLLEILKREFKRPPPLASVSKLVRHECLSVFFRERMFFARASSICGPAVGPTSLFFANSSFLRYVTRLTVMGPIAMKATDTNGHACYDISQGYAEWQVNLTGGTRGPTAEFVSLGTAKLEGYECKEMEMKARQVEKRLKAVAHAVLARKRVAFVWEDAGVILQALLKGRQGALMMN